MIFIIFAWFITFNYLTGFGNYHDFFEVIEVNDMLTNQNFSHH